MLSETPSVVYSPLLVTGASGFLGRHLMPILRRRYGAENVVGVSSADYDLLDPREQRRMFEEIRPQALIHLAAYSGGIGANTEKPADFLYRNLMLTMPAFQLAAEFRLSRVVYTMGGCSYPATATSPIDEAQMWEGFPHRTSAGYSVAKKVGIVAGWAYRVQHGLSTSIVVPGNMYGEFDNFRTAEAHVIPAMLRKFHEAAVGKAPHVPLWGSGVARRDFVYAGDVASVLPFFLENEIGETPVNVSSGTSISIRELADAVRSVVGYQGDLRWDASKPDGQLVKIFSVERLHALGLSCPTPLDEGLRRTYAWLERNYASGGDGIRL